MSEPVSRQEPSKLSAASVSDLDLIVRPQGRPTAIKVFMLAERADAEAYAQEHGTIVEPLLLEGPAGYPNTPPAVSS